MPDTAPFISSKSEREVDIVVESRLADGPVSSSKRCGETTIPWRFIVQGFNIPAALPSTLAVLPNPDGSMPVGDCQIHHLILLGGLAKQKPA
ncbi:hypothetical protein Rvan_3064 [Rhodomicrobium vannielii ATCC 17100]|jgi:hypothetical protein|uniref:Uncharacterized protein n=1 Tax=Rhodomicrobium vannielii (strain ATCC 17100 / DSM 162 / LMG 4299 / NCIMB 10020 / ATH 3.1.1) TaxID=648757 RepID=E3I0E9_RHOVT|nr:hypothetical protein Rvan_3064 [Rhodomicrobium vannielii ATCC 17100]